MATPKPAGISYAAKGRGKSIQSITLTYEAAPSVEEFRAIERELKTIDGVTSASRLPGGKRVRVHYQFTLGDYVVSALADKYNLTI